ncbi:hypothetical protein EP47_10935 [Legionella norrlandica]|uniref:DUF1810 domain-containing protein n=1 Tax=Legionella norrlandica TaxID=1498499 RepID=A0A0A2SUH5_9GAMM|nr:DUF1810 family protein [Legionella norrlandica]KGP63366.1 hypothetical protein EP47_10935 [Legionella norrlandica]
MPKNKKFQHFHQAQEDKTEGYQKAFDEIENGGKKSHWIWYIFPQLKSLGRSNSSKLYGIADLNEACDYLKDPVLFNRYYNLLQLTEKKLKTIPLYHLMGGSPDDLKYISSLTLFRAASKYLSSNEEDTQHNYKKLYETCNRIFEQIAYQGYSPCPKTESFIKNELNSRKKKEQSDQHIPLPQNSFFPPSQEKINTPHPILNELTQYMSERRNEWGYHYNFLGLMAVVYFIQDLILGTDHFNSKAREIKLCAAGKLHKILDPQCHEQCRLSSSERNALLDGRLGTIVKRHGGLEKILATAPNKPAKTNGDQDIHFNPF